MTSGITFRFGGQGTFFSEGFGLGLQVTVGKFGDSWGFYSSVSTSGSRAVNANYGEYGLFPEFPSVSVDTAINYAVQSAILSGKKIDAATLASIKSAVSVGASKIGFKLNGVVGVYPTGSIKDLEKYDLSTGGHAFFHGANIVSGEGVDPAIEYTVGYGFAGGYTADVQGMRLMYHSAFGALPDLEMVKAYEDSFFDSAEYIEAMERIENYERFVESAHWDDLAGMSNEDLEDLKNYASHFDYFRSPIDRMNFNSFKQMQHFQNNFSLYNASKSPHSTALSLTTEMHLTPDEVKEVLKSLQRFRETADAVAAATDDDGFQVDPTRSTEVEIRDMIRSAQAAVEKEERERQNNDDGVPNHGAGVPAGRPVILDLNGDDSIELVGIEEATAFYDLDGDGYRENVGWVAPNDGLLAIDLAADGTTSGADGIIEQGREINFTIGTVADTDLEGLRLQYDSDANGVLDSNDTHWNLFRVWQDLDQDGESDEGELRTLAEAGITSIDLWADGEPEELEDGNVLNGTSTFGRGGGATGVLWNVGLRISDFGFRTYTDADGNERIEFDDESELLTVNGAAGEYDARRIEASNVIGTDGADRLLTTGYGDVLLAGAAGDDWLTGGKGHDWLTGGAGADTLEAFRRSNHILDEPGIPFAGLRPVEIQR